MGIKIKRHNRRVLKQIAEDQRFFAAIDEAKRLWEIGHTKVDREEYDSAAILGWEALEALVPAQVCKDPELRAFAEKYADAIRDFIVICGGMMPRTACCDGFRLYVGYWECHLCKESISP